MSIDALNTAKNALLSHQTAINLTGTNIANVNTPGYTRQRPVFSTLGQSVEIAEIKRIYDRFLGTQINEQMHNLGYNEAKKNELDRIETIFNEAGGGGINELLSKFWSAWEDLSANPSGQSERQVLVSVSQSLTSMFRSYSDGLLSVQNDANAWIQGLVHQVNNYLSDIADINSKITRTETDDVGLNTLKDKRAALLSGLAEIVDFHYFEDSDGSINAFLSNGMPLVEGNKTWELDVVTENHVSNPSFYDVVFKDDPDEEPINSVITNGKLAGFLEMRDTTIKGYMDSLDDLVASLVDKVNTQHNLGYDMSQSSGEDFFDAAKTEAKNMEVSTAIIADINKIAASETVNGDGGNAVSMSNIKDNLTMNGSKSTFSAYYSSLVGRVGQDATDADRNVDHHTILMSQLTNKREEISGVSIDEEMMNLIMYQTGYNAAARIFSTTDELVDVLMNLVR
ncbi:MAG: flagellar hook-associated protein FlgK [Thermodesulfobacteriota bacterium]|nr:flagellar hook-associated protein FlgK [Thermodesulfobacteriota bacterium]